MVIAKEWFTVEEAAEYLCVSKRTIYKLSAEGRLPGLPHWPRTPSSVSQGGPR